jgi:hypothetical protein
VLNPYTFFYSFVQVFFSVTRLPNCACFSISASNSPNSAASHIFHLWLLIAVFPISAYALTMGCGKHKRYRLLSIGGIGLLMLGTVFFAGHEQLGETLEKVLTVIGAVIIALGHY